jgi:hypothetical protein
MPSKRGKDHPCGAGEARNRLATALHYQELATLKAEERTGAARNAAAGNVVLAGIASADAICCLRLGRRAAGSDHADAVPLLELIDAALARQLATLLGVKPIVHYGDSFIGTPALLRSLRAMDHLIAAAEAMLA